MEQRTASIRGIDLVYDYRAGSGTPILFLHGTTATARTFDDVIDAVPEDRPLHNLDLRGHGRSGWSDSADYLIEDHVEDIRQFLADVTGPAVIVGWSLGALTAILVAGLDPHMVKGILSADVTPYTAETAQRYIDVPTRDAVLSLAEVVRALPDRDLEWAIETFGEYEISGIKMRDAMTADYMRAYLDEASHMDPDVPGSQLSAPLSYDIDAVLGQIQCPIRLVRGNRDLGSVVTEEDSERARAYIGDFEERYEPRVGHAVHRHPVHEAFGADIQSMAALVP